MADVRIFRPSKTAMQSGRGNTWRWVLEFEPGAHRFNDSLMGWVGSADTTQQVRLRFATEAEATAFAKRHGLSYEVQPARERQIRPKNYAENFAFNRVQ